MPDISGPSLTRARFVASFGRAPVPYSAALLAGFTPGALRAAVGRGLLIQPRRGVLWAPDEPDPDAYAIPRGDDAPPAWVGDHVAAVRVALLGLDSGAVASYDSAALIQALLRPDTRAPHWVQTALPGAANYDSPGLRVRGVAVPHHHRASIDGIAVTNLARTAIDLARSRPLPVALIPLDSAARLLISSREGLRGNALRARVRDPRMRQCVRDELASVLADCAGWPGTRAVRRALDLVDPAAESALESRSRGWFISAGLGPLDPGRPISCRGRTFWADFCDPDRRVLGEADGWGKYGDTLTSAREALARERERERDLTEDGWHIVRWATTDSRSTVVARMSDALR